jgi:hypothetical protein
MPPAQEAGVRDAVADAACTGSAGFICLVGSCNNDVGLPAVCTNGAWTCPSGTINYMACSGCTGNPPPGYVCTDGGWFRADAGGGG